MFLTRSGQLVNSLSGLFAGTPSHDFKSDSPKRTGMAKCDPPKSRTIAKLIPMTWP